MSEKLREAAQQALTALENATIPIDSIQMEAENAAIAALRSVLEEPEPVQEPVAWMVYTADGKSVCVTDHPADFVQWRSLPLYTAPPQRPPLTDEEIEHLSRTMVGGNKSVQWLARIIERKVRGEKE